MAQYYHDDVKLYKKLLYQWVLWYVSDKSRIRGHPPSWMPYLKANIWRFKVGCIAMAALRSRPSGKKWKECHNMVKMTDPILKNPLPTDIIIPYVYPPTKECTKWEVCQKMR